MEKKENWQSNTHQKWGGGGGGGRGLYPRHPTKKKTKFKLIGWKLFVEHPAVPYLSQRNKPKHK